MVFPIAGGTQDTGYDISNSLRFNDNDSARLTREFDQDPTGNRKTFTISCWVKRSNISSNHAVVSASTTNNFNDKIIGFRGDTDGVEVNNIASGNDAIQIITNRKFRDVSSWYHIVVAIDTTQSALADGVKFYVNGTRDTSFSGTPVYNQNATFEIGRSGSTTAIGMMQVNSSQFFDGYLSDFYFIDGQQLAPTEFGETNDNGVWIPKDAKDDLTFGTNGFYMEFKQTGTSQNSSGIGADTSGNDNHFAVTNLAAIDVTVDTPTNNFCTWNPLYKNSGNAAYTPSSISEGNLKLTLQNDSAMLGTMGVSKGKWYWEYKLAENTSDNQDYPIIGFANNSHTSSASNLVGRGTPDGDTSRGNVGSGRVSNAFDDADLSANDIIGFYLDMDNETLILHKNGSDWMGSGATNGLDFSSASYANTSDGFFYPFTQNNGLGITGDQANFGNPSFSISSSNADANGYGSFEYNPTLSSTNYYALCTKNLAEFG